MSGPTRIAVLGGGAWGTALALNAARAGHSVSLWARDGEVVEAINERGENPRYLPGIVFEPVIDATTKLGQAVDGARDVLVAVPAQQLRSVLATETASLGAMALVLCAKGIERETGLLMSEVASAVLPGARVAALSGPSFATDLARGLPTAVTVAARDGAWAAELAARHSTRSLRCYSATDLTGVEIGGALKNVLAIGAGAVAGAGLGASAQAALVTRGFVELRRIGAAFGAEPETLMGLSGLGDLMLTCASAQSRNFAYGMALARGDDLAALPLAEGAATAAIAARKARERSIEAPIIEAVEALLSRRLTIGQAVEALMTRPLKSERV
jgi:glycerol-3-phosphate dehydrogenase (NAD(P)+)